MDAFQMKTLKTTRGYTYTYYTSPGDASKPTLIFQHGWPDHAAMWSAVAPPLRSLNHPIIIPDMLGYAGTDKPTDPAAYKYSLVTKDLIEILEFESGKTAKAISIGHDWGSGFASRLYNYYPERVVGLVNLNVAYNVPSTQKMDLEGLNAFMEKTFGYQNFAYWNLFTEPDGAELLKNNVEKLYYAMHGDGDTMKRLFCQPNALRNFLSSDSKPEDEIILRSYAQDHQFKKEFIERMKRDGFEAPQCYYKATVFNHQYECDKNLLEESKKVNVPALYIGCTEDVICRPEQMGPALQAGLLPKLEKAEMIECGHWCAYEKPKEVVERLEGWLKKNFA